MSSSRVKGLNDSMLTLLVGKSVFKFTFWGGGGAKNIDVADITRLCL
jgi:hypothetical protein